MPATAAASPTSRAPAGLSFVHGDICDQPLVEATLSEHGIETVVNFAAESHNSLAILDPARFFRTNVLGTQAMCDAARRVGVGRFHHISTCEVYGDLALDSDESFNEESPYRPRTPYNASKAGADHVVRSYIETFGLPATITNCCNNYGPYQFPEKVIPLFCDAGSRGRDRLPLYASTQEPARVAARRGPLPRSRARARPRAMIGETYHVGSGVEASIEQIADGVLAAAGQTDFVEDDRPGPSRARPALPARLDQDPYRARLGADRRVRVRAGGRRSPGTGTTAPGGNRSSGGRRSWRLPGRARRQPRPQQPEAVACASS